MIQDIVADCHFGLREGSVFFYCFTFILLLWHYGKFFLHHIMGLSTASVLLSSLSCRLALQGHH